MSTEQSSDANPPEDSASMDFDRPSGQCESIPQVRFTLPKSARMPAGGAYSRVFQGRRVVSDETISLHVGPNGLAWHRLGLGVAKKMFRRAVARNYVKRLIREAFRLERPGFGGGLDIVVRPKVRDLSRDGLRNSLRKLVPKAERKFLQDMKNRTDSPGGGTLDSPKADGKSPSGEAAS
ncbi:ribonuclease P protein component [bacterium]|nr:ribonuclease P protein component [bacterium]